MISSYFKTAFRTFKRNKSSFLINVIGLSIGMACSILILLWVLDEMNYDRFHTDSDQIYQVMEHQNYSGNISTIKNTPGICRCRFPCSGNRMADGKLAVYKNCFDGSG